LHTPPSFELEGIDNRAPDGTVHKWAFKTHDRLSALDDAHARIAPYAHQLRVLLTDRDDLVKLEDVLQIAHGLCRPIRVSCVDAFAQGFFSNRYIHDFYCWIKTINWKSAFQIESYLRCGLLNTHELLFALRDPIEDVIRDYGNGASELLRLFSVALRTRNVDEAASACLAHVRAAHPAIRPLRLAHGKFLCHHVVVTPTRMLLEGPYAMQSNRVIRHYLDQDPTLSECFVRVEFRDEEILPLRWDGDVDGTWFLRQHVGGILREGFELCGRPFKFLACSMSGLREHAVWFVTPFHDPAERYVDADIIRASLGDFSSQRRTPSLYAARIAQAFTPTDPGVKIRRDQWEEQDSLGPHTDSIGTISPALADRIWEERCRTTGKPRVNCVPPSAYQFCFLGYKGIVAVDHRLEGIKMRLRASQRKFPVHNVEVAELEIVRSFNNPDWAHLSRFVINVAAILLCPFIYLFRSTIMTLEDLGVKKDTFVDLQDSIKACVCSATNSLDDLTGLFKSYNIGGTFQLPLILEWLTKLGLGIKEVFHGRALENPFLAHLIHGSVYHMLYELKYKVQIPVPGSYRLAGVVDEGQAYINEGIDPDRVFTLKEGFIYGTFLLIFGSGYLTHWTTPSMCARNHQ
jgi:RNA-dependent RNA polymerase